AEAHARVVALAAGDQADHGGPAELAGPRPVTGRAGSQDRLSAQVPVPRTGSARQPAAGGAPARAEPPGQEATFDLAAPADGETAAPGPRETEAAGGAEAAELTARAGRARARARAAERDAAGLAHLVQAEAGLPAQREAAAAAEVAAREAAGTGAELEARAA